MALWVSQSAYMAGPEGVILLCQFSNILTVCTYTVRATIPGLKIDEALLTIQGQTADTHVCPAAVAPRKLWKPSRNFGLLWLAAP